MPPAIDDKVLTDWNGLMIAALAKAGSVLNEAKYIETAKKTADFILNQMRGKDGVLYHRYAKGETAVEGFLDDYAFFVYGSNRALRGNLRRQISPSCIRFNEDYGD